jgi:cytoskeleton protein RodZ
MTPVGETLRRERLKRHLELDQISQELKISRRMLEAIEEDEFDRLPGGVFTKSFVLQYAKVLGLDQEELANQVQQLVNPPAETLQAESGEPAANPIQVPKVEEWDYNEKSLFWGSWMPAAALVIVAMLVCSGIYGWWQRNRHSGVDRGEPATASAQAPEPVPGPAATEPAPPAVTQPIPAGSQPQSTATQTPPTATQSAPSAPQAVPAPTQPTPGTKQPAPAPTQATPAPTQPTPTATQPPPTTQQSAPAGTQAAPVPNQSTPAPAQPPENTGSAPQPSTTPDTASAPQPPQQADQVNSANPNAAVRVALTAEEPVWISAHADGKQLYSVLLNPNESRTIEAKENVVLRLGNAGGISVKWNGQPVGSLGGKGQARTVQFTPGGFQIVAAPPKPSLPL